MARLNRIVKEQYAHLIFKVLLVLKGFHACLEIVGGAVAYFITRDFAIRIILSLTHGELVEDPHDFITNYLIKSTQLFSVSAQHFAAFYLLSHGIIKIVLIIQLLRKKLWAYPASIVVFSLFIVYQLYRFTITHSLWLIVFTILDVIFIWLTFYEYRYMKGRLLKS